CWEIDVRPAIIHAVVGAVVTCRGTDSDPERSGVLEGLVECLHGLPGPSRLRIAPTNRDYRRRVALVMDCSGDRVKEAAIGVGREVDDDLRPRCYGPGHFDVEHDFSIGTPGISSRLVGASVHPDIDHSWQGNAKLAKVGLKIGRTEPTAQFNQSNGLSLTIQMGRKFIELS